MVCMDALDTEKCCFDESIDDIRRSSAAEQRQAKRRRHMLLRRVACFLHVESVLASRWMPPVRGKHVHGRVPSDWLGVGDRVVQLDRTLSYAMSGARLALFEQLIRAPSVCTKHFT